MGRNGMERALDAATWIVAREAQRVIGLAKSVKSQNDPSAVMSSQRGWRRRIGDEGYYAHCCTPWRNLIVEWA